MSNFCVSKFLLFYPNGATTTQLTSQNKNVNSLLNFTIGFSLENDEVVMTWIQISGQQGRQKHYCIIRANVRDKVKLRAPLDSIE